MHPSPWLIIRLIIALILGIIAARLLRQAVRVTITRLMPMRKRMADNFYYQLSQRSLLAGLIIALAVSISAFAGLSQLPDLFRLHEETTIDGKPLGTGTELSILPAESLTDFPNEVPVDTNPEALTDIPAEYTPEKAAPTWDYYAQINAFHSLDNARRQFQKWPWWPMYPLHIAHLKDDSGAPYKMLVGPFDSKKGAEHFLSQQIVPGFPRAVPNDYVIESR